MPNKVWLEEKFIEKAGQLKARFTHADPQTLLPVQGQKGTTVPLDGLCMFLQQTWDVIKNQKELNLPDQRQMVANYRCGEIKQEALDKVAQSLSDLLM